ncbi:MAG: hypothetical protein COA91_13810 [Robiginitomaculum sp.]|nr:MAG: hypothetical protein COA91_13810 [Robiginitomaculum sp.]
MFILKVPNVTEKERALFDLVATNNRSKSKELTQLIKLGFKQKEIESYAKVIRYVPRYVEAIF